MGQRVRRIDWDLVVWGVAAPDGTVRSCRSRGDAAIDAGRAGPLTVPGVRLPVSRLVYHHPDLGWTYAAIGRQVNDADR